MASDDESRPQCLVCDNNDLELHGYKAIPCCDETCLERIADRECALECGENKTAYHGEKHARCCGEECAQTCSGKPESSILASPFQLGKCKRRACSGHASKVRKDFADVLEKVGCICRELISRNLEPCCKEGKPATVQRCAAPPLGSKSSLRIFTDYVDEKDSVKISSSENCCKNEIGHDKTTGCTNVTETGRCAVDGEETVVKIQLKDDPCGPRENRLLPDGCYIVNRCQYGLENSKTSTRAAISCHNGIEKTCCETKVGDYSCCGSKSCGLDGGQTELLRNDYICRDREESLPPGRLDEKKRVEPDIEKAASFIQHISLAVEGLTCVGCEMKLVRALRGIPGLHNINTSLVLSRAEFELDEKAGPVDDIIKAVEKCTGFACMRLNSEGQELDVVIDGDAKAFIERRYPEGIMQLCAIDKHTVRITFDPTIVGARAVIGNLFGMQLKLAAPRTSSDLENGQKHVQHTAWVTLLSAALTLPVLVLAWASLPPHPIAYGAASLALATAVQSVIAGQFYVNALRALIFTRVIEMDLLIVLSTSTAYIFSIIAFAYQVVNRPLPIREFFETSTLLVTLIMLGRLVSAFARQKAVESVSLRSIQDQTAVLCDFDGHNDQEIDARLLQHGDLFKVAPDSRVVTDGVILTGSTEVDESMVTGESLPVEKHPNSFVVAGSINGPGVIVARVTNLPRQNTISTIAAMVDEAKFRKPQTQELVDIVAGYFVPVILVLTIITFVVWIVVGVSVRRQSGSTAVVTAITYGVSVLIVSCPCAIGLCIPMVILVAGGAAAKHGVVFKSALALERARKVSHVVFDKTGTLTTGELSVIEEVILADEKLSQSVTLGLTSNSRHPVSAAISSFLLAKGVEPANIKDIRSITAKGVEGMYAGDLVRCGNTRWLSLHDVPEVQSLLRKGLTVFGVAIGEKPLAIFGLSDSIRSETKFVLAELQKRKIAVSVVSGDDAGATETVAVKLEIPLNNVRSRCTPADKQQYLKTIRAKNDGNIIFCGDGTNDAVALAEADIGVHMSSGSEMAQTAADIILLRPVLTGILVLLDLSRAAMHRVFLNLAWSFVYNLFAILLAAGAFVHARIPPQYAGLGELVSVLPVILIALQLRWFKRNYESRSY
ncbi:hypothetical protein M433DRAFT_138467 [Acidomyces richmondensis BFW]|nr:hypothetical protein M433DRAFT_138467 [Acidomyces richmondensis BFW]